jgi:GT2 family glycosyltransferase
MVDRYISPIAFTSSVDVGAVKLAEGTPVLSVSVVIPTWRRAAWLDRCLGGLLSQSVAPDETIVVGRPEDEEARSTVQKRSPRVRWVEVNRPGHVAPVIRGIGESRGDVVAMLDDDVVPVAGWLEALLMPFLDPSVACVGGRVVTRGMVARVKPRAGRMRWYGQYVGNAAMVRSPTPLDVASVAEGNSAWRRSVIEEMHFDPRLDFDDASMYGLDLTLQARERGFRIVYQPAAVVLNFNAPRDPRLNRADRRERTFSYSRNYSLIASRHLRGVRLVAFWLWWVLIGERGSYGLATGAVDLLLGRTRLTDVVTSFRGKILGARLWLTG